MPQRHAEHAPVALAAGGHRGLGGGDQVGAREGAQAEVHDAGREA